MAVSRARRWRTYVAVIAAQIAVAVVFLATGLVDFTLGNVVIMAVVAWSAYAGVAMVMRGAGIDQR